MTPPTPFSLWASLTSLLGPPRHARLHIRISLSISVSSTYPTLSYNTSLLLGFDGWNWFGIALQDMQDMRDCYDTLLSAAAATASSAYGRVGTLEYRSFILSFFSSSFHAFHIVYYSLLTEFSESLRDMGSCLLEKTALNDHADETGTLLFFYFFFFHFCTHFITFFIFSLP